MVLVLWEDQSVMLPAVDVDKKGADVLLNEVAEGGGAVLDSLLNDNQ